MRECNHPRHGSLINSPVANCFNKPTLQRDLSTSQFTAPVRSQQSPSSPSCHPRGSDRVSRAGDTWPSLINRYPNVPGHKAAAFVTPLSCDLNQPVVCLNDFAADALLVQLSHISKGSDPRLAVSRETLMSVNKVSLRRRVVPVGRSSNKDLVNCNL